MPPCLVLEIPAQGVSQAVLEIVLRHVAEFGAGLGLVDGIAAVVALAVLDERLKLAGGWPFAAGASG